MSTNYARHLLTLEIDGIEERLPLSSLSMTHALNQIPSASIVPATGRDDTGKVALIHDNADKLQRFTKAKAWLRTAGVYDDNNDWPDQDTVIFDGRIASRGMESASLSLTLEHWLADLDYSTALVSASHPASAADLTFAAVRSPFLQQAGAAPPSTMISSDVPGARKGVDLFSISQDLWSNGFKQILCAVAGHDHVSLGGSLNSCNFNLNGSNQKGQDALSRMEGPSADCGQPYVHGLPLKLNGGLLAADNLYKAMTNDLTTSYLTTSLWGKLVQHFAPAVQCAVVPTVDRALFVPLTAGLRQTYCKEITVDDWERSRFSFPNNKPLKGVGIAASKMGSSGITQQNGSPPPNLLGMGGCFSVQNPDSEGTYQFLHPPLWLNNVAASDYSANHTSGIAGGIAPSSALTPLAQANPNLAGNSAGQTPAQQAASAVDLFRAYARTVFVLETLRGRSGTIAGKLRFDIAPGTSVLVRSSGDPFLGPNQQLVTELIGLVVKVSHVISAEPASAMTHFELAYLRTPEENKLDGFSLDAHPLFETPFVGCPLIADLAFGAC